MSNKYFITTSIPYVNSVPHVGHAQEFILADAIARFHRQKNAEVILQSGTDDNAFKNVISARDAGVETKTFVDQNAHKFKELLALIDVKPDFFVRTSSDEHATSVNAFLDQLNPDDIYSAIYSGLYCQGCEDFYNESELIDGLCPDHKNAPGKIEEENFFFRLSNYQEKIYDLINSDKVLITPNSRKNEVLNFISSGLRDISISRSSARSGGWGIPLKNHPDQVVYVWIDALVNYLSGPGFGRKNEWEKVWNEDVYKIHVIGKNVWKFHAIYWIGLLLSANLPLPNEIFIHGFLTNCGVKISKSLNNGGNLPEIIANHGSDALRFYLLQGLSFFDDADFSNEGLIQIYNSELANKFGNLVSRVLTLRNKSSKEVSFVFSEPKQEQDFRGNIRIAFEIIRNLNSEIEAAKPWQLLKTDDDSLIQEHLERWLLDLSKIVNLIEPVLPNASTTLRNYLYQSDESLKPIFPRIQLSKT